MSEDSVTMGGTVNGVYTETVSSQTTGEKDGVTASATTRKNTHLWQPGQSGNPLGRPSKRSETAIIKAMNERIHPEIIADKVDWLLNQPTWKPVAEGLKLYFHYMVGPAPARTPEGENMIDVILARMRAPE